MYLQSRRVFSESVVSLTTMNGSFNAIAQNLNVQRLYEKAFDQVLISPTPLWQFIAGQIIGGSLRGFYAGGVILILTLPIDTGLIFNGWSFLVMFLNGAVFSAIGVVVSFLAKNHADVPRFSNYIIMPMAYLCNTFFSTEKLPGFIGKFVAALPLSQTSHMIRTPYFQIFSRMLSRSACFHLRRLWNVLLPNSASTNQNILFWIRSWYLQADIV